MDAEFHPEPAPAPASLRQPGKRPPAYSMRALGRRDLPETVWAGGSTYRLIRTVKHDFFAATGFYRSDDGREAVLKLSRTEPFAGFSLAWVGRLLCRRELRFYNRLADVPNVPAVLGRVGSTGFLHEYIAGRPLSRDRPVPDGFFDRLQTLIAELHRRQIAYVDANKPQNILLGDDGDPYLIDFQISWDLIELYNTWLNRWWLRRLQRADLYHVVKHKKRMRPDEMTEGDWDIVNRRSILIRLHRLVLKPYFKLRRRTFRRLRETGRLLPEGSK
jgi:RIO-like serine/threonine protein kinase